MGNWSTAHRRCRLHVAVILVGLSASLSCASPADEGAPAGAGTPTAPVASEPGTTIAAASAPAARVTGAVTGGRTGVPFNAMPEEELRSAGYAEQEYFIEGDARLFTAAGDTGTDGRWDVAPTGATAPYKLRIVVRRPVDADRFNGTVLVEWLNVSAGMDADPDFGQARQELGRSGYAYIGVSAQKAGVDGGGGVLPVPNFDPPALKEVDGDRYGSLVHPGDDYSYDIFAQVGAALRRPSGIDALGGLAPRRIIAAGESQSAGRMATFVNAVHPVTRAYDGFFIHSRGGSSPPISAGAPVARNALIRTDLAQPVLQFVTETDLFFLGFHSVRQPDTDRIRTWEVAGTAHADQNILDYGVASGKRSVPGVDVDFSAACGTMNDGPQTFVLRKAIDALNTWVRDGTPPARAEPLVVRDGAIARDQHGNALGGIRTPAVDVPVATLSGETSDSPHVFCRAFGSTRPFTAAALKDLYATHQVYVDRVSAASSAAVAAGFLLPADKELIDRQATDAPVPG